MTSDAFDAISLPPERRLGMNSLEDALRFLAPDETARAYLDRALAEPIASGIPWMDDDPEPALRAGELIEIVGAGGPGRRNWRSRSRRASCFRVDGTARGTGGARRGWW